MKRLTFDMNERSIMSTRKSDGTDFRHGCALLDQLIGGDEGMKTPVAQGRDSKVCAVSAAGERA
ncbi:hypothetical protein [Sulfuritalea sp.]|uniref:hypothetical protein n=1 Tax=Sulfuritalea sp. TaxID=2480090 RepID=UPI00286E8419|nr:hypothetical protein [Sulfuritalea sp.]